MFGDVPIIDTMNDDFSVSCEKGSFTLRTSGREIDLLVDRGFYYPESFSLHSLRTAFEAFPLDQRAIALDSWVAIWEAVEETSRQRRQSWINAPCFARIADNKAMLPFIGADRHGFSIPDGAVSNDPDAVFRLARDKGLAVKAASRKEYLNDGFLLGTQHFSVSDLEKFSDDIAACPLLYQDFLVSPEQYRLYIFQHTVLCFRIVSDHSEEKPDIRVAGDLDYEIASVDLPAAFVREVQDFVLNTLQIEYAALDFLADGDRLTLIDINPNGVWNWMPDDLREQVDDAFLAAIGRFVECS
jgi:hypothetical protein